MATKQDLIGLGLPWPLANIMAMTPVLTSAVGATAGSATQLGPDPVNVIVSGTSSVALPQVGGQNGVTLGTPYVVGNITGATIAVYTETNSKGSAVTVYSSAASGVGLSLPAGKTAILFPVTISTWLVNNASAI